MIEQRICIVGLGLMGGSLALALRPYCRHLTAVDANPRTLRQARTQLDHVTSDFAAGVAEADLVIFATPVRTIVELMERLGELRPDGCMVFDLGSTKADICRHMEALPGCFQAMGGHPMCGKETSGFESATAALYRKQTFVLCENGRTTEAMASLAYEIVTTIGAIPVYLDPIQHDEVVALVSHLPYLVSATLMGQAADKADGNEYVWPISAGGLRDTTRLAGSCPQMMLDILLTNQPVVLAAVEEYERRIGQMKALLQTGDRRQLQQWLEDKQFNRQVYVMQKEKQGL